MAITRRRGKARPRKGRGKHATKKRAEKVARRKVTRGRGKITRRKALRRKSAHGKVSRRRTGRQQGRMRRTRKRGGTKGSHVAAFSAPVPSTSSAHKMASKDFAVPKHRVAAFESAFEYIDKAHNDGLTAERMSDPSADKGPQFLETKTLGANTQFRDKTFNEQIDLELAQRSPYVEDAPSRRQDEESVAKSISIDLAKPIGVAIGFGVVTKAGTALARRAGYDGMIHFARSKLKNAFRQTENDSAGTAGDTEMTEMTAEGPGDALGVTPGETLADLGKQAATGGEGVDVGMSAKTAEGAVDEIGSELGDDAGGIIRGILDDTVDAALDAAK